MQQHSIIAQISCAATIFILAACQSTSSPSPVPTPQIIASEIDEIVETAMRDLDVIPGFALAIYTPEGTYMRGFGVTDIETGEAVSADTAFYIASTTKAFTGLAMNVLHHRGELNLDMSIADFAPELQFAKAVTADAIKLRDLLTHTHGIDNQPLVFRSAFSGQHTPDGNWALLETDTTRNKDAPLGRFQYTNAGYNILTVLTDRQLNLEWQDLLAREIFSPAGMEHTSARMSDAITDGWFVAKPHQAGAFPEGDGFVGRVARLTTEKNDSNMQSAGGMIMSANDAARWLELLVEDGKIDGRQIIPVDAIQGARAELVSVDSEGGGYTRDYYGLGWYIGAYKGDTIISHGGGFAGYSTRISYMPERKIGVASFANESTLGAQLPVIINNYVYDRLTGRANARKTVEERISRLRTSADRLLEGVIQERRRRAAREWALTQPFENYAGTYVNQTWGDIEFFANANGLSWQAGQLKGDTEPFPQTDTARIELIPGNGTVAGFTLAASGEVTGVNINTSGELSWFRNTKSTVSAPDTITLTEAERKQIVGTYEFAELGITIEIAEIDGAFFAEVAGQGAQAITAISKNIFIHPGSGSRGQFIADGTGEITKLLWEQAGQTFEGVKTQ